MKREKDQGPRRRLGRVFLSYGVVFFIGLWVGHQLASSRKAAVPESERVLKSTAKAETQDQRKAKRSGEGGRSVPESSSEGDVAPNEDLSLTFYDKLLKKEPLDKSQPKGGVPTAETGPRKGEGKPSEKPLSAEAPFTIQVGSFDSRKPADDLTENLKGKGYPAYITTHVISGMGRMYQVRIGHYRTLDEAKREAKHIEQREKLETYIPPLPKR
jgi:cell division septation protein DedD